MDSSFAAALKAYNQNPDVYGQRTTISLAETSLLTPNSPDSFKSLNREDTKKPTKKRKSWGQELPTPKTNLPPRKRAKTEDEKEQRRIERVLRNRQAAQSSRERKRQEVEKLEGEKDTVERQNHLLRQRLIQVEQEKFQLEQQLAQFRGEKPPTKSTASKALLASRPPSPSAAIKQELLEDYLPSPQNTPQTLDPRSSFSSESPSSSRSCSPTGTDFDGSSATYSSDMTQHPAAMLCGLQCLSEAATWRLTSSTPCNSAEESRPRPWSEEEEEASTRPRSPTPRLSATHLLSLTLLSTVFSTLLSPLSQICTFSKTGSRPSTPCPSTMAPMTFLLTQWLISTPGRPRPASPIIPPANPSSSTPTTPATAATTTTTTTPSAPPTSSAPDPSRPRTSSPSPSSSPRATTPSTFRISLLRRLLASSPAMARPLRDATGRALQMKTSYALRGLARDGGGDVEARALVAGLKQCGVWDDSGLGGWQMLLELWESLDVLERERERKGRNAARGRRRQMVWPES